MRLGHVTAFWASAAKQLGPSVFWDVTQRRSDGYFTFEDGTDRLSRNVGTQLQTCAV